MITVTAVQIEDVDDHASATDENVEKSLDAKMFDLHYMGIDAIRAILLHRTSIFYEIFILFGIFFHPTTCEDLSIFWLAT